MGIGFKELLIIAVIALLLFGTRKLRSLGSDFGGFLAGIRSGFSATKNDVSSDEEEGSK